MPAILDYPSLQTCRPLMCQPSFPVALFLGFDEFENAHPRLCDTMARPKSFTSFCDNVWQRWFCCCCVCVVGAVDVVVSLLFSLGGEVVRGDGAYMSAGWMHLGSSVAAQRDARESSLKHFAQFFIPTLRPFPPGRPPRCVADLVCRQRRPISPCPALVPPDPNTTIHARPRGNPRAWFVVKFFSLTLHILQNAIPVLTANIPVVVPHG